MTFLFHSEVGENEWALHFKTSPSTFDSVYDWFKESLKIDIDFFAAWRTDRSSLTIFVKNEKALALALLRWS